MKTKIDYMHMLTQLPISDLKYMFWQEEIKQDYLDGKFNMFINSMQNQQDIPFKFVNILNDNFWELISEDSLEPEQIRIYNEWDELLNNELGKQIEIDKF
jgi:hypothetical protein